MSEWNPNLPEVALPKTNKPKRKKKSKQLPKKRGRKKLIRQFKSTFFGRSLMLNAPLEYDMIMAATGGAPPDADFIEQVSYSSTNPYFKTRIFRRYLIQYRQNGSTADRRLPPPTPEMVMRALNNRRQRLYGF